MRQYISVQKYFNKLAIREIVDGHYVKEEKTFKPYLFEENSKGTYLDFNQEKTLDKVDFPSFSEMNKALKDSVVEDDDGISVNTKHYWGCKDPCIQYINDTVDNKPRYDTFDTSNLIYSIIDIEVMTRIKNPDGTWFDGGFPEAADARFPINAICDYRSDDKKYHVFTTAKWDMDNSQLEYKNEVDYHFCEDEKHLLDDWLKFWAKNTPHIISGWNNKTFDIPYIINRIKRLSLEKIGDSFDDDSVKEANKDNFFDGASLSPFGHIDVKHEKDQFGHITSLYSILGVATLDYLDLYKKYRYKPREKYTLAYISACELNGEHKLEFEGTHGTLYWDDPQFFIDYNIQDVRCIVKFEELLQFINLACFISYYSGVNIEDSYSPIKVWETLLYKTALNEHNIVMPIRMKMPARESYEGAYVHPPKPGLYGAVASYDYTSLYPSIIMALYTGADVVCKGEYRNNLQKTVKNMLKESKDPLAKKMNACINKDGTFVDFYINNDIPKEVVEFLHTNGLSMTPNLEFFKVNMKSVFVDLVNDLFKNRKADKKTSFKYKHMAQEIKEELEKRGINIGEH